jgi:SAM-dependent methyltransferase
MNQAMNWQHGYRTEVPYTCSYFRELAPDWLDLAALLKGHPSPRAKPGAPFRYLELGSGMGLNLCLHAALYPEGEFIGVDFNPDHIVHSQRLCEALQLRNVSFVEADILTLASQPADLTNRHDYVIAHGVATWVKEPVRQALMQLAATALRAGGFFYCSYNTLPGWLQSYPLRQLARAKALRRGSSPEDSLNSLLEAAETLKALIGPPFQPNPLAMQVPGLRNELTEIQNHPPEYLIQEYMNDAWEPMAVNQIHDLAASYKLRYVSSATLSDNLEEFLNASVRDAVLSETDPTIRQTLQDLATNKRFRRDIFCRGMTTLTSVEFSQQFRQLRVALNEIPQRKDNGYPTSFGVIHFKAGHCMAIEDALASGSQELGTLQDLKNLQASELAQVIVLLLEANRIGLDRGNASLQAQDICQNVNRNLAAMQVAGRPYTYRAAASLGTAIKLSLGEALTEAALEKDPEADPIPAVIAGLDQLHISNTGDISNELQAYLLRRPGLQRLGVIGPLLEPTSPRQ